MELRKKILFSFLVYSVAILQSFAGRFEGKSDDCGPLDWKPFGHYKCFKLLPPTTTAGHLLTYEEAAALCRNQNSRSTLPSITSASEQIFVANLTSSGENFWLGGKLQNTRLFWDDLTHGVNYTNWSDHIKQSVSLNGTQCVQSEDNLITHGHGKWNIYSCNKKYLVALVCQKPQYWSTFKMQAMLQSHLHGVESRFNQFRQEINSLTRQLEDYQTKSNNLSTQMESLKNAPANNLIPIGFVYVQYKDQPEPGTIWPRYIWTDISSNFAGQFFRAVGGNSGSFGSTQSENVPKITTVTYLDSSGHPTSININYGGNTGAILSGIYGQDQVGLIFTATGGEVRPYNSAVKIWKRTR